MAKENLDCFEARPDAAERPEVPECRSVLAEFDRRLGEARPEC